MDVDIEGLPLGAASRFLLLTWHDAQIPLVLFIRLESWGLRKSPVHRLSSAPHSQVSGSEERICYFDQRGKAEQYWGLP